MDESQNGLAGLIYRSVMVDPETAFARNKFWCTMWEAILVIDCTVVESTTIK
jgi:hypothetical protein